MVDKAMKRDLLLLSIAVLFLIVVVQNAWLQIRINHTERSAWIAAHNNVIVVETEHGDRRFFLSHMGVRGSIGAATTFTPVYMMEQDFVKTLLPSHEGDKVDDTMKITYSEETGSGEGEKKR